MMQKITVALIVVMSVTSGAFANTTLSETASPISKITQGHGASGDTASSSSDPDVSFRVLDNGKVERTNSRYGIVSTIDPMTDYLKKNRR
ncbi:hypothetical protein [Shinella kummerowiae]|jgi:hypothetical protein|uniref:DUF680 domain-containing protein n=1 Tax=Shinella kummerowiae TaxID=417745 RepID=A0A6N8S954_9HYPH|nr:hypothetical protein [Shinella kummerowiae]MCT7664210.1 hypothetical protein [Shinella kummerowiae]MXN45625.1 hypothetical protein [Shinella kummerowiae]